MSVPRQIIDEYLERRSEVFWQDVLSHANAEQACSLDYQGRFLYELLQNAVDRADDTVRIHLDGNRGQLLFGNDGEHFSIYPQEPGGHLSDFHALCSIHTSSKSSAESIGNKGVGVKSVWEVADRFTVWSRHPDDGWWGFRLHRPLLKETIRQQADEHARRALARLVDEPEIKEPLPSFYFPEPCSPPAELPPGFASCKTVLALDWEPTPEKTRRVEQRLDEFCSRRFFFVTTKSSKRSDVQIDVSRNDGSSRSLSTSPGEWTLVRASELLSNWKARESERIEAAGELGLHLKTTDVVVAFPPEEEHIGEGLELFYSYLPTEERCGFSVLVHADFFLDNSRKAIDFDKELNAQLVGDAADVLLAALTDGEGALHRRHDVWRFLDPRSAAPAMASSVGERLFGDDDRPALVTKIAHRTFSEAKQPMRTYQEFLSAMDQWRTYRTTNNRKDHVERHVFSYVRHEAVRCLPLSELEPDATVPNAVALPELDPSSGKKKKGGRTVFFRGNRSAAPLPARTGTGRA